MIEWITAWPTWEMIRIFGVISFVLLSLGVCIGIMSSIPVWKGRAKLAIYKLHMAATIVGTGIGLLHGAVTVIDKYVPYSWYEVLVPFTAEYEPLLSGLGTLAAYGMLVVIFTTDIRGRLGKKAWRTIHMLSYPLWIMTLVHGFYLGSDSGSHRIRFLYMFSIVSVLSVTMLRLLIHQTSHKTEMKQRRAIRRQD
ncbi:ferric reductase-like transmembrane domain-containing protein [Paenibacillus contaminans]|nr:ferric reductase-like transmembrane domain-containing protein [Paenibacillus contaminans]